jgi:DNA-binding LacI/PurR family transcriptional regulator
MLYASPTPGQAVAIGNGGWQFVTRALDYLAAHGRKRIAVLDVPGGPLLDEARLTEEMQRRGLTTRPYWILPVNHETAYTANKTVHLLMSVPTAERPDGLVIINPFLVEHATVGLVAADVRVPKEADVVAGGNFPYLTRALVPVKWLGTDMREGMRLAIELIDRQRQGETVPEFTDSENIFEEQLPAADPLKRLAAMATNGK